jgi:hypothetical protein
MRRALQKCSSQGWCVIMSDNMATLLILLLQEGRSTMPDGDDQGPESYLTNTDAMSSLSSSSFSFSSAAPTTPSTSFPPFAAASS